MKKILDTILVTIMTFPLFVFGQGGFTKPIGADNFAVLIKQILDVVVKIGAVIVVFFVIYAGLQFVLARGNESKLAQAKQNLLYVLIGAVVLLGAQALSEVICHTAKEFGSNIGDCIIR